MRRSRVAWPAALLAVVGTASAAAANPSASVRVTNGATAFDLAYASSASALGGFVVSDNAPSASILRGATDAFTIASISARALAGELIYRAAGDASRECTFRYVLTYAGGRFTLTADARASWTSPVTCTATTTPPDKTKGDFTVTFTMK